MNNLVCFQYLSDFLLVLMVLERSKSQQNTHSQIEKPCVVWHVRDFMLVACLFLLAFGFVELWIFEFVCLLDLCIFVCF